MSPSTTTPDARRTRSDFHRTDNTRLPRYVRGHTGTVERVTFHKTSRDTGGEYVLIEAAVAPGGGVASHVHPYQTEEFEVLSGSVEFRRNGEKVVAHERDSVTIEPGTIHRFKNVGAYEARFTTKVSPALEFESFLETMFALAADGKTNKKGLPNPFQLAVIAKHHFDDVRLPFPPRSRRRLSRPAPRSVDWSATRLSTRPLRPPRGSGLRPPDASN